MRAFMKPGTTTVRSTFMKAMTPAVLTVLMLAIAACSEPTTNPPTEPAAPIEGPGTPASAPAGLDSVMPGAGPASFVGRWAADVAWCASPQGDGRPITLTPTRFEGYENSCAITTLTQVPSAYEAELACEAEGQRTTERVRFAVSGEALTLSYLDRQGEGTVLTRCPAD